jgi:hypothetical protein
VEAAGVRTTALVVDANRPLDSVPAIGNAGRGVVRILVTDPGPHYVAGSFKMGEERWLVPGMEVPVVIDPAQPDRFEIDWDAIPSIEDRVAANDPTLADPAAARAKAVSALRAAGLAGPDPAALPAGIAEVVAAGDEARKGATPDRFEEAMEQAARTPAPSGKTRAVVRIATSTATLNQPGMADAETGAGAGGRTTRDISGKRKAVLSVNVPGRAPYAVLDPELDIPKLHADVADAGIPALVSAGDPNEVEVLWDELPPVMEQVGQRITDALQGVSASMEAEQTAHRQLMEGMGIQQQMAASAKQVLAAITDPGQRRMMIEQYRAMGIEVDEEDLAP